VPAAQTNGVEVEVVCHYLSEHSDIVANRYVFAYHIVITNRSANAIRLMRRHWYIDEGDGIIREVEGQGVVGEQPILEPGEAHEYSSGAILENPRGTMKGSYEMHSDDGSVFGVEIPEFALEMPRTLH